MLVLTKPVQFEEIIKGSRFLSELIPCESQAQAYSDDSIDNDFRNASSHVLHRSRSQRKLVPRNRRRRRNARGNACPDFPRSFTLLRVQIHRGEVQARGE